MASYSYLDERPQDETENYDSLIEYRADEFKEFSGLIKDLSTFRNQARAVKHSYATKASEVEDAFNNLNNIDSLVLYLHNDPVWKEKVTELKNYYLEKSEYDEMKAELARLEEQKCHVETITSEFKIQHNQVGMCSICSERPITVFLDPCGHVSCQQCMDSLPATRRERACPFCRGNFTTKKIFSV